LSLCFGQQTFTIGILIKLGVSPILWSNKQQPTISSFSIEVEYRSLANATKEMIWFQILLLEVHLLDNKPMITTCDNQSAIKLVGNSMFHVRKTH
jgi:hypothetical protein